MDKNISFEKGLSNLINGDFSDKNLVKTITTLGFNQPKLFGDYDVGGIMMQQIPQEIADLAIYIKNLYGGKNINYLEIGVGSGATLLFLSEYFKKHNITTNYFGADNFLYQKLKGLPEQKKEVQRVIDKLNIDFYTGDSKSKKFKEFLKNKEFDIIFIDGDHSYEGVIIDFFQCIETLKEDGIVIFHDVASEQCPGVVEGYKNIKELFNQSSEFVHSNVCGIGVCKGLKKSISLEDFYELLIWKKSIFDKEYSFTLEEFQRYKTKSEYLSKEIKAKEEALQIHSREIKAKEEALQIHQERLKHIETHNKQLLDDLDAKINALEFHENRANELDIEKNKLLKELSYIKDSNK